jgi:hypothetical protein
MNDVKSGEIPIIIWADLESAPLGQTSKLLEDLAGRPVLRQTLERVCRSEQSGRKIVYCRPEQADQIRSVLAGLAVEVLPIDVKLPGWWPGLQATRKWALECWRGGLLGSCAIDEDLLIHILTDLTQKLNVSAVMAVSAHAAWVDPKVLDRQIEQYQNHQDEMEFNFTQAPPGLTGVVLSREFLTKLPQTSSIAGSLLGYIPNKPQYDSIFLPCNLTLEPAVVQTGIRFTCDTQRGLSLARKLAEKLDPLEADIVEVTACGRSEGSAALLQWPREIEIELTPGWPWPEGYRPHPAKNRGPIDAELLIKRIGELTKECDDLVVYLGGFGEPTAHPQFDAIVNGLKSAGVWGIGVQTCCLFEPGMAETLAALPLDAVSLLIDTPERERYAKVMGLDGYETVLANIEKLLQAIKDQHKSTPLPIPEMIKTDETMELMDEFYDGWLRKVGWATIKGFSDYAGQVPDQAVNSMAGPERRPCRQIFRRMTILADGKVALCDQDFEGSVPLGSIQNQSLSAIWQGPEMSALRQAHLAGDFSPNALCEHCRQWHRP